jgi:hypothetical protein
MNFLKNIFAGDDISRADDISAILVDYHVPIGRSFVSKFSDTFF